MNPIDTTNEKLDEIDQEDFDENEGVDNSDDLAQKKRTTNELNAKNNTAQHQVFIQNLDTLNINYLPSANAISQKYSSNESYNLRHSDGCIEFVEKFKDGEYLTIAIILCTFEAVSLGDLPNLKSKLMEYLPKMKVLDSEGTEIHCPQQDPYISLNSILTVVGGKRFVTEDGQQCIGLGEGSKQALINIWEQFPVLRSSIVSWLIHLSEIYEYRTTFDAYQIATAFARIVSLDFIDAKKRIFPQLYSNPNNAGLMGVLAYKLYEDPERRKEMEVIVSQWIISDSTWLWKPACLVYAYFMENGNYLAFEPDLKKAIRKRLLYFNKSDFIFVALILCRSKHFRLMITDIFHISYGKANTRDQKITLAQIYVNLVRRSYYLVNASHIELPLVACDTKEQQLCLAQIIAQVMSVYHLRKHLFAILDAYLKEISNYNFPVNVVSHISAYFYNMALPGSEYQQDIMDFLKNCQNKVAQQIYNRLYQIYSLSTGGLLT